MNVIFRMAEVMKAVIAAREFSQKEETEGKEDGRKRQLKRAPRLNRVRRNIL